MQSAFLRNMTNVEGDGAFIVVIRTMWFCWGFKKVLKWFHRGLWEWGWSLWGFKVGSCGQNEVLMGSFWVWGVVPMGFGIVVWDYGYFP